MCLALEGLLTGASWGPGGGRSQVIAGRSLTNMPGLAGSASDCE